MGFDKCYGCLERHIGCHSDCKHYISRCNEREKEKVQQRIGSLSAFIGSHSWSFTKNKKKG